MRCLFLLCLIIMGLTKAGAQTNEQAKEFKWVLTKDLSTLNLKANDVQVEYDLVLMPNANLTIACGFPKPGMILMAGDSIGHASWADFVVKTAEDVYITDINKGVIMKSPNGKCWRMTITDQGTSEIKSIECPTTSYYVRPE